MSDHESVMTLDGGLEVSLGLNLPNDQELELMSQSPVYPEDRMLDDADIKKALANDRYKQVRKKLAPWMVNQSPLGKCNASALKGAIEHIRSNQGMPHIALSDNDAYMQMNGGRDNGSALIRAFQVAQTRGIAPLQLPSGKIPLNAYNPRQVSRQLIAEANAEAKRFQGWEWYRAPRDFATFARCLASELARDNPVVFAWHVGSASSRLRNGYVVTGNGKGNHATYFSSAKWVGGRDIVHPDCKNTWGPSIDPNYGMPGHSWGEGGFALFTMEQSFACNEWHDTYIVTSAKSDHKDQFLKV